jgi:hypothetical protein
MTHGDRTSDGEGEILSSRKSGHPKRVIGLRDALIVAGLCMAVFSGVLVFSLRSLVREEIVFHNNDSRAHPAAMEPIHAHIARQEAEIVQSRDLLERVARIEAKVTQSSEAIVRIEEHITLVNGFVGRRK